MIPKNELRAFLLASNMAGYAGGEEKKWVKEKDGSTTIPFRLGDWSSHDNFFGGEPYGGRTIVSHLRRPVWIMVYYGWVAGGVTPNVIYTVLRSALKRMPPEAPFRGPKQFAEGSLIYVNAWEGDVERFSGEERITQNGKLSYKANYMGGWVDERSGV